MLSTAEAKAAVEKQNPGTTAEVCVTYNDLYLVRVKHADPDEVGYDPFYSVHPLTGEVKEFSVLTDGNIVEIAKLFK